MTAAGVPPLVSLSSSTHCQEHLGVLPPRTLICSQHRTPVLQHQWGHCLHSTLLSCLEQQTQARESATPHTRL
eukprot:scaffold268567_cov12-Tisochrysis_lutea.AAC.1